jgi:hypothetical protein
MQATLLPLLEQASYVLQQQLLKEHPLQPSKLLLEQPSKELQE